LYQGTVTLALVMYSLFQTYNKKYISHAKMYFVPPNLKTWPRACWYIPIRATIKTAVVSRSKQQKRKNMKRQPALSHPCEFMLDHRSINGAYCR